MIGVQAQEDISFPHVVKVFLLFGMFLARMPGGGEMFTHA